MWAPRSKKTLAIVLVAMAVTLIAALVTLAHIARDRSDVVRVHHPADLVGVLLPEPKTLDDFELTDHQGGVFNLARLRGQWSILFFGYTHCPDVCPMAMGFLGEVFSRLGDNPFGTTKIQGIFISVDPKRDTPELLKGYVAFFNPGFLGVTGKEAVLKGLTHQVGAYYATNQGGSADAYEITHSSAFFLIAPTGKLVGIISPNNTPPEMAAEKIKRIVNYMGGAK
ncbi:MAG: SCO family protein [Magnetococcales bacterium]|nr:SCO family protein [Magnetococcales bacterium]